MTAARATDATVDFYRDLPALRSFTESTEASRHVDLPGAWWVVITDVAGSTLAIETGAYQKVNTVGVACIAAVANIDRALELPFVFGGDGATMAIPDALHDRTVVALRGAQRLARESFGLDLRAGLVRIGELQAESLWVRLAKVRLSRHVTQPVLSGRGWDEAERRLKDPAAPGIRRVAEEDGPAEADFSGFECRWQNVPSFRDHKLSLLVSATSRDAEVNHATYRRVLEHIGRIYGEVAHYHPLRAERMRLTFSPALLSHEGRVRTGRRRGWQRIGYLLRLLLLNLAGRVLFARDMDTAAVAWSRYRDDLVENTDFRKFDGMLRLVIDGSEAQAAQLQAFLEEACARGDLVYGLHKSREALVTCIVRSYERDHLHFVDGSDGGYALAARDLKRRLEARRPPGA